jgi:hypothetical protein
MWDNGLIAINCSFACDTYHFDSEIFKREWWF